MAKTTTPADKLRKMFDSERIRCEDALAILNEEWENLRPWAEALSTIADQIDAAAEAVEEYQYAEGRDEKADAKDALLGAFEELLSGIEELDGLDDLPNICESPVEFEFVRIVGES